MMMMMMMRRRRRSAYTEVPTPHARSVNYNELVEAITNIHTKNNNIQIKSKPTWQTLATKIA